MLGEVDVIVDEFLRWADGREGHWELRGGAPFRLPPENALHARVKTCAAIAFMSAIKRAKAPCEALVQGLAVRVDARCAFLPDALAACSPLTADQMDADSPSIALEVLSPSTAAFDHGAKLEGYFSLPSLAHYLLIDPERRVVIQHSRGREGVIETRILRDGEVKLNPPGLAFAFAELFGD
jgi:Uma2 family endonuclease